MGPVGFAYDPALRSDLNMYPNKDALLFPEPVPGPGGEPSFALLHRPMWDLSWSNPTEGAAPPPGLADQRPGVADVYYGMADARIGAFRLTTAPLPRRWA